jgi:hypothetical protein
MLWVLGAIGGILQAAAFLPYLRDVLRGTTRPHRGTWLIWCLLSVIVLASQRADGGRWSLLLVAAQCVGTVVTLSLAIPRGVGGAARADLALLAVAGAGVAGWYVAGDPTIATLGVVVADTAAVLMMLPKTYRDPRSETLSAYWLSTASVLFAAVSVGSLNVSLLLYPAYLTVADSIVIGIIMLRRRQLGPAAARTGVEIAESG